MSYEGKSLTARSWRIALAAVLAFACSQLVFAGHQFEHDASGIDEVCAACLQLEQFDHPVFAGAKVSLPVPGAVLLQSLPSSHTALGASVPYSTRAPPIL